MLAGLRNSSMTVTRRPTLIKPTPWRHGAFIEPPHDTFMSAARMAVPP
jgi:hypothetical protein